MSKLYYWEQEVKDVKWNKVILINEEEITLNEKEQEIVLSTEPKNLSDFTYSKANNLTNEILKLLEWYENIVLKSDIQHITHSLMASVWWNYHKAVSKAIWIYDEELSKKYWPQYLTENISLKDIKRFL